MIYVSYQSTEKTYHTKACPIVSKGTHYKEVTTDSEIEHYTSERRLCKHCEGFERHKNTSEGMHYMKLKNADIEIV